MCLRRLRCLTSHVPRCAAVLWIAATAQLGAAPALRPTFPAPGATDVCPDTPLRLTFERAPVLGAAGRIRISEVPTGREIEVINVGSPIAIQTIGGEPNYRYYPVILSGNTATIHPRHGSLSYGRKYAVTLDPGVFVDGQSSCPGLDRGWTFTTRAAGPTAGATTVTVAADGSGDFCTVQGALDFVPDGNTTPRTILIRKGTYTEIVFLANKHALTIRGEDRRGTVIEYPTNDRFNPSSGNPFGDPRPNPAQARHVYHRGVFLAHRANDLTLENFTVRNTTPQGGSQAEAIILNGTPAAHAVLQDLDLFSYQDTLQVNGQAYLSGLKVQGDVDFLWGTGPCFFTRCTFRSMRSGAYYTQVRNPATNHGFVFVACTFEGGDGVTDNYLSRIGTGRFPHSEVVLVDCVLTSAVHSTGWQLLSGREGNERDPAQVHFWEFNSRGPDGRAVDTNRRLAGSRQLSLPADEETVAHYRDPAFVLGGWNPATRPAAAPVSR